MSAMPNTEVEIVEAALCDRFHYAIELVGRRWTGAIIEVLMRRPHRFTELRAAVPGLSERLLVQRLSELRSEDLVVRRVLPGPPVGVEYELTEAGRDLRQAMTAIADWARRWLPDPAQAEVKQAG